MGKVLTLEEIKFLAKSKRPKIEANHKCQYCDKAFSKESTLFAHVCEQKRRWMNKDEKYVRTAFYAYNVFYTKHFNGKQKTYDDFAKSKYYTSFTRFARHLLGINCIDPEGFVEFLIKTSVPLDDWTKDYVYETFVREFCKKETAEAAASRNILLMEQWATETENVWTDFFEKIEPGLAVHWIKSGRISPWVIFCCESGDKLFDRLTDEQLLIIQEYIDPKFWNAKLRTNKEDEEFLKLMFKSVGM